MLTITKDYVALQIHKMGSAKYYKVSQQVMDKVLRNIQKHFHGVGNWFHSGNDFTVEKRPLFNFGVRFTNSWAWDNFYIFGCPVCIKFLFAQ